MRTSAPLASAALGALVRRVWPMTVHCGAPPDVSTTSSRARADCSLSAAKPQPMVSSSRSLAWRTAGCDKSCARAASTHAASCSTTPRPSAREAPSSFPRCGSYAAIGKEPIGVFACRARVLRLEALLKSTGDSQQMAELQLSFACGLYDRMQPLYTGEVKVEGIDLNFIAIDQPRPIFDRMAGGEEFDVAEFSSSEFVQRFANKQCPFVAIPVFPSRAFRHGFIAVHRKAGIKTPKDLEGKRVGVPLFTMTAAIYINGLLQHEYGVDLRKIHWVQGAMNTGGAHGTATVLPLLKPMPIEQNTSNKSMSDLIE